MLSGYVNRRAVVLGTTPRPINKRAHNLSLGVLREWQELGLTEIKAGSSKVGGPAEAVDITPHLGEAKALAPEQIVERFPGKRCNASSRSQNQDAKPAPLLGGYLYPISRTDPSRFLES